MAAAGMKGLAVPASGKPHLQRFLDRLTSRSVLSIAEQQAVLELPGHAERHGANHDIVGLAQCVDHACFVMTGFVGRFNQTADGARQITAIYVPGDMPDLYSVVQPNCTWGLQALSAATVLRVPHRAVRAAAGQFPAVAEAFWRDCVVDAGIHVEWVTNVGRRDARTRLSHLFCELAERLGVEIVANQRVFALDLTQAQLSDATGLSLVHVNRVLKELREAEVLQFRGKTVRVSDWDKLVGIGDFDPTYLQMGTTPAQRLRLVPVG
jgi:CRP-like cAMP-binding protein